MTKKSLFTALEDAIEPYLSDLSEHKRLRELTIKHYRHELIQLSKLLTHPTQTDAIKGRLKKLKPSSVTRKIIVWRGFLKFVGGKWSDALDNLSLPKFRAPEPAFLNDQEAFALEAAAYRSREPLRNRLLLALGLQLGLRVGEILKLRFEDFNDSYLKIERKGGKIQRLPLPKSVELLSIHYQRERHAENTDLVFLGSLNRALTTRSIELIIKTLAKDAKISKKISPHTLRHSFASKLAAEGASLPALKEILGHERLSTTERYLHVTPEHLRDTLELLSKRRPPDLRQSPRTS